MALSTWSTKNQPERGSSNPDPIAVQLATIVSRLESFESLKDDVAALKDQAVFERKLNEKMTWKSSGLNREEEAIIAQLAAIGARLDSLVAVNDDVAVIKVWMDDKEADDVPQGPLIDQVMEVDNGGSSMSEVERVPKNYVLEEPDKKRAEEN
ncbi:hypothetical protein R6Q59_029753 [Mikania micrantha]